MSRLTFDQLQIDGFGHFHELTLKLGPKLNVLHGENGAGKSTLMAFVRSVLFGFARRNTPERYDVQGGRAFGGRVVLTTGHGELWVQRLGGKRMDGDLLVKNGVMAPVAQEKLNEALGLVDRDLFEQVFAFGLDQLRDWGQLMEAGRVRDAFAAAAMPGAQRLPIALERLDAEAKQLWGAQATARELNVVLQSLAGVRARLQQLGDRPKEHFAARALRETVAADADAAGARLDALARELFRLDRLRAAAPDVDRAVEALRRVASVPIVDRFPEAGLGRLDEAERLRASARAAHVRAAAVRDDLGGRLARVDALVHARPADPPIVAAIEGWQQVALADATLDERRAAFGESERRLTAELRRLGCDVSGGEAPRNSPAFSSRTLEATDTSAAARSALVRHRTTADDATRARASADQALALAQARADDAGRELGRLDAELAALAPDAESSSDALAAARALPNLEHEARVVAAQVDDRQTALAAAQAPDGPAPVPRWPLALAVGTTAVLLAATGAAFVLAGPAAGLPGVALAAAIGGLLLALHRRDHAHWLSARAAHQALSRHRAEHRARLGVELSTARARLVALEAQLARLRAAAGPLPLAELERRAGQGTRRAELSRDSALARARLASATDEVAAAEAARDRAQREVGAAQDALSAQLTALGLPASLDAAAALELLTEIAAAQRAARALADESAALDRDTQRVAAAAEALDLAVRRTQVAGATAAEHVAALRAWLDQSEALRTEQAALRARHDDATAAATAAALDAAAADRRVADLISAAGVTDPEDFRRRGAAFEARAAATRDADHAAARVHAACGSSVEAAHAELLAGPGVDARLAAARAEHAALQDAHRALLERKGGLTRQLEVWEADGEIAPLLHEEQRLAAQATALARRYAVVRLGAAALDKAREKFEAEHQPQVVSRAAQLFATLTAGAFPRLAFAGALEAIDRQGRSFSVDQLSRGTKEALLIALRVAMVEDFGRDRPALPVMVDDVLVNLDPRRAEAMVEVLAALSHRHQVLAFTCHPRTRQLLEAFGAHPIEVSTRAQLQLLPS